MLGGGVIAQFTGPLLQAYQAKLDAANSEQRIEVDKTIDWHPENRRRTSVFSLEFAMGTRWLLSHPATGMPLAARAAWSSFCVLSSA
jgi:hypothetical protein